VGLHGSTLALGPRSAPLREIGRATVKSNLLGVKGVGEAGTVGALPAVIDAVTDTLAPLGIRHIDMEANFFVEKSIHQSRCELASIFGTYSQPDAYLP
jgi:hypothetical protein